MLGGQWGLGNAKIFFHCDFSGGKRIGRLKQVLGQMFVCLSGGAPLSIVSKWFGCQVETDLHLPAEKKIRNRFSLSAGK